jgi:peptidase E
MTTYLLHGGKTSKQHSGNDDFFAQFTNLVKKNKVTILLCYFSRDRSEWGALIERDSTKITANTQKQVAFLVAEDPKDLSEKLERADVLYVAGGDAEPIEKLYSELENLRSRLDGKVYAGSSMGAFLASESYVLSLSDQKENEVHRGVGLLPIQTLCHWNVEPNKDNKLKLLKENSDLPIIVLNEFETVTIYA